MLKNVYINNLALIDDLDLECFNGMTTITGETGAGKSIIIDAVELALGKRASIDVIKTGLDRANICVLFDISTIPAAIQFLKDNELDHDDECIIRRIICKDGRSKSEVNDIPITQQRLRELSDHLINIHGQHEFQTLLKREHQRTLLDNFSHHDPLLKKIKFIYASWRKAKDEWETLSRNDQDFQSKINFLTYQKEELEALHLSENEFAELHRDYKQLSNSDLLIHNCQTALNIIDNDDHISIIRLLNQAYQTMSAIGTIDPLLQNSLESIQTITIQTKELSEDLRHFSDNIEADPERLIQIEDRLNSINDLAKKHRVPPEDLSEVYHHINDELEKLQHQDERINQLQSDISQLETEFIKQARVLSKNRKNSAKQLSETVTKHIQELGMPNGSFEVALEPIENETPTQYGLEKITFLISANPGQPLKPLTQVASGGELSRISLAIQTVTAKHDKTPSLIFDEIDSGIGGATADIVGKLMQQLGQITQLFCITHLPQIAAKGHNHLQVEKISDKKKTATTIRYLDHDQKIQEIARMLGGIKITEQTLAHAKEMIENSSTFG